MKGLDSSQMLKGVEGVLYLSLISFYAQGLIVQ